MNKAIAIAKIISNGRAPDLLLLMEGESIYTHPSSELVLNNLVESKLWRMALEHVRFICEFGKESGIVKKGDRIYSAYPEEFNEWLTLGAPGLVESDLRAYLNGNPV